MFVCWAARVVKSAQAGRRTDTQCQNYYIHRLLCLVLGLTSLISHFFLKHNFCNQNPKSTHASHFPDDLLQIIKCLNREKLTNNRSIFSTQYSGLFIIACQHTPTTGCDKNEFSLVLIYDHCQALKSLMDKSFCLLETFPSHSRPTIANNLRRFLHSHKIETITISAEESIEIVSFMHTAHKTVLSLQAKPTYGSKRNLIKHVSIMQAILRTITGILVIIIDMIIFQ